MKINTNKLKIISTRQTKITNKQFLTKYLYKRVFTREGRNIGRIIEIVFDKLEVKGFIVAKNLIFRKIYIGMEYTDKFTTDSVILRMTPIILLKGMTVFDSEGKIVGKVKSVKRKNNSNNFDSITVKKTIFSKEKTITPDQMVILKKNIRLKIEL